MAGWVPTLGGTGGYIFRVAAVPASLVGQTSATKTTLLAVDLPDTTMSSWEACCYVDPNRTDLGRARGMAGGGMAYTIPCVLGGQVTFDIPTLDR